jgi:hypothetical protein
MPSAPEHNNPYRPEWFRLQPGLVVDVQTKIEAPFSENDFFLFYRNNPDYPRESREMGKRMDAYKDSHFPGPWTKDSLQMTWEHVKPEWLALGQQYTAKLERARLEGLVRDHNTEMVFDNPIDMEREA